MTADEQNMRLKSRISVALYNTFASLLFRVATPPVRMRKRFELVGVVSKKRLTKKYPRLRFEDHDVDGVHAESITAVEEPNKIVMHLHGGAYIMGSSASFRVRAKNISYRCNARVYLVDYRQSPENRFPAALDDAYTFWSYIIDQYPNLPIYLSGDSCGGGLALSLMMLQRDKKCPLPNAAVLFSPWTDLANTGESIRTNKNNDGWLTRRHLEKWSRHYLGDADARNELASPFYGSFSNLPPLLFIVGGNEILLDDSLRCAKIAEDAGVNVEIVVGQNMSHDYPLSLSWLAESKHAWNVLTRFFEKNGNE